MDPLHSALPPRVVDGGPDGDPGLPAGLPGGRQANRPEQHHHPGPPGVGGQHRLPVGTGGLQGPGHGPGNGIDPAPAITDPTR